MKVREIFRTGHFDIQTPTTIKSDPKCVAVLSALSPNYQNSMVNNIFLNTFVY